MSSLDSEFYKRLSIRLTEMGDKIKVGICEGNLEDGYYKRQCGYLKALQDVSEVAQTIETNINEGK